MGKKHQPTTEIKFVDSEMEKYWDINTSGADCLGMSSHITERSFCRSRWHLNSSLEGQYLILQEIVDFKSLFI